jgi:hypothetical protein
LDDAGIVNNDNSIKECIEDSEGGLTSSDILLLLGICLVSVALLAQVELASALSIELKI